ncbi:MAG: DNRLRE domain-containing protein, partial [Clostridia bacterium]|nr:DNRLRE domain-containing protein [Clostridia bacterium]
MKRFTVEKNSCAAAHHLSAYIGYQAERQEGGVQLALILGFENGEGERVGCEITVFERDGKGEVSTKALAPDLTLCRSQTDGYPFEAVLVLPPMPKGDYFELVVRPFVLGEQNVRAYGDSAVLTYTGKNDSEGYPILERVTERFATVYPTDDTFVFGGIHADSNFGTHPRMQCKNEDESNVDPERACYFKFRFTPEQVRMIARAASVKLCVYPIIRASADPVPNAGNLVLHATDAAWDQNVLTYNNREELAALGEYLSIQPSANHQYVYFDVREYLKAQSLQEDGSLTVSFRVTSEGEENDELTYIEAMEKGVETSPKVEILTTVYTLEPNLTSGGNEGYEPWGYAEYLANRWFGELRDKIYPKDKDGNPIVYGVKNNAPEGYALTKAAGDFTGVVEWQPDNYIWVAPNHWEDHPKGIKRDDEWAKDRYVRTLSTLGKAKGRAYLSSAYAEKKSEYDIYGGIANAGFKGEATGFFHLESKDGRPYIIDPLGNPYFAVGVDDFRMYNEPYALERYGSEEAYYEATTERLKAMGINTVHVSPQEKVLAVKDGLSVVIHLSAVGAYMRSLNRSQVVEGRFPHNNTVNIFDPDFAKMSKERIAQEILDHGYHQNPRVLGYTTDNELPGGGDVLTRYLTVDPSEPTNAFSYATAWTWLARRMNTVAPTITDYLASPEFEQMNSEFLSFIYSTYYGVAREAIEAVDRDHMYLGSRVASNCRFDEGYLRAEGYYLDAITTN